MTEGQRWAEALLGELRASRFTPQAGRRFLARSLARASETRRERRREHRWLLVLAAAGLGVWAGVALAHPWLALAGGIWWAATVLMVDWHLGMLERADGTPVRDLGIETVLTMIRAGTVPALLVLDGPAFAGVLALAGATDALDGPLARRRGRETRLGFWLDGSVDTLVLGAAAVGLASAGELPGWAALLLLARYGLPWLVVPLAYFALARAPALDDAGAGRVPGLVVFAGLAAAAFGLPGGAALVGLGSVAGLGVAAAAIWSSLPSPAPARPRS